MNQSDERRASRIIGVDAYRGIVMFLMMAEVLRLAYVHRNLPESRLWMFLAHHQTHVPWVGCSLHDLIQPSFSFLVGVALPFSLARRREKGQGYPGMTMHAAWRAFFLVVLGILLRSLHRSQTYFTFEDTLSQIGLGYFPLFLVGLAAARWRWLALAAIVGGYWLAFAFYPLPDAAFDYAAVGVPADWQHHASGLAAHWNKNSNLAWAFETWFLNLFPRESPFTHNGGGYVTLSFIPTLGTMILGLIAGDWLRQEISVGQKLKRLVLTGIVCLAVGLAADQLGICPNVKRIWTPSWVMFSGGWCFLALAACYVICDVQGLTAWAFPFRVIGANSITAYCIAHLTEDFFVNAFKTHLGQDVFKAFGAAYEPLLQGSVILLTYWLILYWMYRRGIFLRI